MGELPIEAAILALAQPHAWSAVVRVDENDAGLFKLIRCSRPGTDVAAHPAFVLNASPTIVALRPHPGSLL
jgi:hypothetical protein